MLSTHNFHIDMPAKVKCYKLSLAGSVVLEVNDNLVLHFANANELNQFALQLQTETLELLWEPGNTPTV